MHKITQVAPASAAARAKMRAGLSVISVNGRLIKDIIDWKHALAEPLMRIRTRDPEGHEQTHKVIHASGSDIGLGFDSPTIDALQICQNNCLFCFVRQMPPHQRDTLYVKDDDYRLSLMYGSFVSLTNIDESNWQRILNERISPIYVSVHTTNPDLRVRLMQNPHAAHIAEQLTELTAHGIAVHAQLVLLPGLNDGAEIERSLDDLTALYPGVASVAVVPVGLTGHRAGLCALSGFDTRLARDVLRVVTVYGQRMRRRHGVTVVYAADEFYVLSQADFPRHTWYDDYPQLENGVGLCRTFIDDFRREWGRRKRANADLRPAVWLTGESAQFFMRGLQHLVNRDGVAVDLVVAKNKLFGGRVTVTGLLGGGDICAALNEAALKPGSRVLIPAVCLRADVFLDGYTLSELCAQYPELTFTVCPTQGQDLARMTKEE